MDKAKLAERLMATFLGELEEHVRTLDQTLLALEKTSDPETRQSLVATLFRIAHSLKGASRAVDAKIIERACHHLEEILSTERLKPVPLSGGIVQLLLDTGDALSEAGHSLREKRHDRLLLDDLLPRLELAALSGVKMADSARPVPKQSEQSKQVAPALAQAAAPPVPNRSASTVPVAAEKLDALLARGGELLTARRRIDSHVEGAAAMRDSVTRSRVDWQRSAKTLRRMLAASDTQSTTTGGRDVAAAALVATNQLLDQLERDAERLASRIAADHHQLERLGDRFDEDVRALRLTPFSRTTEGLDRVVRDLAREADKEVDFAIEGADVEVDRSIAEALRSPLIQLVRNAVAHGIEPPEVRRKSGKAARGTVSVGASLRASRVEIVVADDGRGIDRAAIRAEAQRRAIDRGASDEAVAQLIFTPGFSTAAVVDDISGRGVGLDIVKSRIDALRGSIRWESQPGSGTRFTISVPLTLTTIRALLVQAAGQTFALESSCIVKLLRATPPQIRTLEGRETIAIEDDFVPLFDLGMLLGLARTQQRAGAFPVVSIENEGRRVGLVVDDAIAEQDVLATSLGPRFIRVRNTNGATLLPDGRVALILNPRDLTDSALRTGAEPIVAAARPESRRRRILVADDSVTTRALEKSILEAAGFEVIVAPDGMEAWRLLQEQGADLLVSDVEMPRMDGFALTETVRSSPRFRSLPVVLLTALARDSDKARGLAAGADAYLVKSSFDQTELIETISELL